MHIIIDNIKNYTKEDYNYFLSLIKKEKAKKISNKSGIKWKQSILGEYLLIKALNEKYNINYNNIKIIYNKNGKPYIYNNNIFFNISHSNDLVVCVLSDKLIGVDVEKVKNVNFSILNSFCTKEEKKFIRNSNSIINIFKAYTEKEALLKMYGLDVLNIKNIKFNFNIINIKHIYLNKEYFITIAEKKTH